MCYNEIENGKLFIIKEVILIRYDGTKNLIPYNQLTKEKQRELVVKGGKASVEARRRKKTMLQTLAYMMNDVPKDKWNKDLLTNQELVTLGLISGARKGDAKNYQVIQEQMEKREQMFDMLKNQQICIPARDMGKAFIDLYRDIKDRKHREYFIEGGRGSIKSSFWSELLFEELEEHQNMCAIVIRMVANTLKDSAFAQAEWGLDKLNETYPWLNDNWKSTKSPLQFKNKKTGQIVYFRGADDPGKIKSIRPPKGMYIGIIIYEEFDQMKGMAEVRKIDQSVMRGGEDFIVLRVYNTPRSTRHFVNVEKRIPKESRLIHRSTYLDVPVEWLGTPFFEEAEHIKNTNETIYRNEYLGEETGDGGNVFENLEIRDISDDEINTYDYIYEGLDFGWYPDPLAWTKMCYNTSQRTLYIFDEFVVNKMSNSDVWEHLKKEKNVTENDLIIADSAEPKSIGDFKSYGAFMKGAEKPPGSVEYSMKWLASLTKIVIDAKRCPRAAKEFTEYECLKDKDENYISGYPDEDNHTIDSVRYALNDIWKKKGY